MGKKKTFQEVKQFFREKGWALLSNEYVGADAKLLCKCPNGHTKYTTYHIFQQNKCKCAICAGNSKRTDKEIIELLSAENYILISVSPNRQIKYKCSAGHIGTISLHHFISGSRCRECVNDNKRLSIKEVRKKVEEKGWKLFNKNYENARQKLDCVCDMGHKISMPYYSIINHGCGICHGNKLIPFEKIEECIISCGYNIIGGKSSYKNTQSNLELICPNGHLYKVSANNFRSGYRCPKCKPGRISKVSQNWLGLIGILEKYREKYININGSRMFVDGIDEKKKIIYEFFGDYWHGHPTRLGINGSNNTSFLELYENTIHRLLKVLEKYSVMCIWEYEFNRNIKPHFFNRRKSINFYDIDNEFKEGIV